MRIHEFLVEDSDQLTAQILTTLEFLRNRDHNKKLNAPHSTAGFINMVNNMLGSKVLTYQLLQNMMTKPAFQNLITNLDEKNISFKPFGDEPGTSPEGEQEPTDAGNSKDPTKIVGAMAKRAASNRS